MQQNLQRGVSSLKQFLSFWDNKLIFNKVNLKANKIDNVVQCNNNLLIPECVTIFSKNVKLRHAY